MRWSCLLSFLLFLGAQPARAQEPPPPEAEVARLHAMMQDALFEDVLVAARAILARTDLDAAQRNATLESLAIAQLATRDRTGAQATLVLLYSRDPDHRMLDRDASPAVATAFERARGAHPTPVPVTIESATPAAWPQRTAPVLQVRITAGADTVNELRLSYRQGDAREYQRVLMEHGGSLSVAQARIPVLDGEDAYTLEWYVEGLTPSQTVTGRLGDATTPLALAVPRAPVRAPMAALRVNDDPVTPRDDGGSVFGTWWFWTVVGLVVAGGAVSAYLLTQPDEQTPCGTLGCGSL